MSLLAKIIIYGLASYIAGLIAGIILRGIPIKRNKIGKIQVDDGNENIIFRLNFDKDPIYMRDMKEVIFTIEKDASLTMPDDSR